MDIDKLRQKQAEYKIKAYYDLRDGWCKSNNKEEIKHLEEQLKYMFPLKTVFNQLR